MAQLTSATASIQAIGDMTMSVLNLSVTPPANSRNLTGGNTVAPYLVKDLNDELAIFFAFPDMSVRTEGVYTLQFALALLPEPPCMTSSVLATVFSTPFEIFPAKRFPGMMSTWSLL
ncbi:hypothetical protein EDD11_000514 [Mortierella claussenii]|nr:hypothetical protein EDD11_000514 [Mortierella claussenii]